MIHEEEHSTDFDEHHGDGGVEAVTVRKQVGKKGKGLIGSLPGGAWLALENQAIVGQARRMQNKYVWLVAHFSQATRRS